MRLSFVLYYLTVEKVETFLGASPGGVNIYGAVSFCCSLVSHSLRSFIVGLLFFLFLLLFFHMFVSRGVSSLRLVIASRHAVSFSCVPLRRVVRRLVSSARFARPSRMGAVSSCCSLVIVLFVVA